MKTNAFMLISMCMGVLSIITSPLFFVSLPLAGLSILFAILSKGKALRMDIMAKVGVITSSLGIVCCVLLTGVMAMLILFSPDYRSRLNETSQMMYGQTFDEMMEMQYGVSLEEIAAKASDMFHMQ
ncbi:MAG: hypothetical protein K6E18_07485 [Lachnospiraceae bacterium]|nr:hypothetical protein [Lachnospiraceae bacterium]